jgi:hypothetical protein
MDLRSLSVSKDRNKLKNTKASPSESDLMNFSEGRETTSQILPAASHPMHFGRSPLAKPLPQWNISSATLRNSPSFHRFSKSERFSRPKCSLQDSQLYLLPSTLSRRASAIGFGEKFSTERFSRGVSNETKLCPFYNVDVDGRRRSNSAVSLRGGKTFGLSWKHFESSRTPQRNSVRCS